MMNQNPTFDPARSAAIKRMLMETVERDAARTPGLAKRVALLISLIVATVALATGGTALALGGLPFFAPAPAPTPTHTAESIPTPTPTATPTPTPTVAANSGIPRPTVPVDCATLGPAASIEGLVPNAFLGSDEVFTPELAALRQAGVLSCQWNAKGIFALVAVDVAADAASGHADIASQTEAGAASLDVGDASAVTCQKITIGCRATVVAGAYWLSLEYEGPS